MLILYPRSECYVFKYRTGYQYPGGVVIAEHTEGDCEGACLRTSGCIGFNFFSVRELCSLVLLNQVNAAEREAKTRKAVKRDGCTYYYLAKKNCIAPKNYILVALVLSVGFVITFYFIVLVIR